MEPYKNKRLFIFCVINKLMQTHVVGSGVKITVEAPIFTVRSIRSSKPLCTPSVYGINDAVPH
jgi:hypothetical protein